MKDLSKAVGKGKNVNVPGVRQVNFLLLTLAVIMFNRAVKKKR